MGRGGGATCPLSNSPEHGSACSGTESRAGSSSPPEDERLVHMNFLVLIFRTLQSSPPLFFSCLSERFVFNPLFWKNEHRANLGTGKGPFCFVLSAFQKDPKVIHRERGIPPTSRVGAPGQPGVKLPGPPNETSRLPHTTDKTNVEHSAKISCKRQN